MSAARVYLDSNATTRPLPEVVAAMRDVQQEAWGNPSSLHAAGRAAARRLAAAREAVAAGLGATAAEVVFTSGGTESDRLGVLGALACSGERRHVVATEIEHPAVRSLLQDAPSRAWGHGVEVTWVLPDATGAVRAADVRAALRPDTALVAVQWANNETGVVQPVHEIAADCRTHGVPLLVDAVQAVGKLPVDVGALGAALVAVSAHKIHGPQGVGALVVRDGARWQAPFPGSQEAGRRAGTEAVAAIAGFAAAITACAADPDAPARMAALRDRFERVVVHALGGVRVNGTGPRTPNTSNLEFAGLDAERLLALLDRAGVDASNGSACSSASPAPSHVLTAMGRSPQEARSAVRFSLARTTTDEEIDRAAGAVIECVETLRRRGA